MRQTVEITNNITSIPQGIVQSVLLAESHMLQWLLFINQNDPRKVISSYKEIMGQTGMCIVLKESGDYFYEPPRWWIIP